MKGQAARAPDMSGLGSLWILLLVVNKEEHNRARRKLEVEEDSCSEASLEHDRMAHGDKPRLAAGRDEGIVLVVFESQGTKSHQPCMFVGECGETYFVVSERR